MVTAPWLNSRCYTHTAHVIYCTSVDRNGLTSICCGFVVQRSYNCAEAVDNKISTETARCASLRFVCGIAEFLVSVNFLFLFHGVDESFLQRRSIMYSIYYILYRIASCGMWECGCGCRLLN